MFTFCVQKDTIRVEPCDFGKDPAKAMKEEINRRYANKVIPDAGLCVCLFDILESSEGAVLYGDGCFYYKTVFRLLILRPHVGETIVGKVRSMSEVGIKITLGFFDDILIPPKHLPGDSCFDTVRQEFFWVMPDEDEEGNRVDPIPPTPAELLELPEDVRLYVSKRDWVRITVEEEHWDDSSPISGKAAGGLEQGPPGAPPVPAATSGKAPYSIVCSMSVQGTGPVEWWDTEEEPTKEA